MSSIMCVFFFFKQKTAYEMRISDWSSDVCSSDPVLARLQRADVPHRRALDAALATPSRNLLRRRRLEPCACTRKHYLNFAAGQIGRASCRERVCQYV